MKKRGVVNLAKGRIETVILEAERDRDLIRVFLEANIVVYVGPCRLSDLKENDKVTADFRESGIGVLTVSSGESFPFTYSAK